MSDEEKTELDKLLKNEGSTPELIEDWLNYETRTLASDVPELYENFLKVRNSMNGIKQE